MKDPLIVLAEMAGIQIKQNKLAVEIAHKAVLVRQVETGNDISKHQRDHHGSYWNDDYAVDNLIEVRSELRELQSEFDENQKRLHGLQDELLVAV